MFPYLLERAKEPSSWRGAIMLLTVAGVGVSPELTDAIITAGIGAAGLLGVISKG